jgi:sulfopropanediol 3-dehydrogenase
VAEYLKRGRDHAAGADWDVVRTVAEILSDVPDRGEAAVRDWSAPLDGWSPESSRIPALPELAVASSPATSAAIASA